MRRHVFAILLLVASVGAHAAPEQDDSAMQLLLAEKGIAGRLTTNLQSLAGQVKDTTSELVMQAMGFLGVPYRRGGTSMEGFDCSGFVYALYEQAAGLVLPRRAEEQARATQTIDKSELQPGDLVFFNTMRRAFSHVGIYVGDGKFIHSPRTGASVRMEDMSGAYWQKRFDGARRVPAAYNPPAAAQPPAQSS